MLEIGQIRLLHILPGNRPDVSCRISTVALASAPPYDALSYTWGSRSLSHGIELAGEPTRVTSNLHTVLRYLRYDHGEEHTVWVDAICIDQQNDAERTAQVKTMAEIYRRARQVIMWVGEETEFDGMAFGLLEKLGSVFKQYGRVDFDFEQPSHEAGEEPFCPGYGLPLSNSVKWNALARLFLRPYIQPIWVVQEIVMASRAVLLCGRFKVEWELVRDLARSLRKYGHLGMLLYEETAPGIVSVNAMAEMKNNIRQDIISLLLTTRAYQATEPVNKVFALMSLATNPQDVGKGGLLGQSI